MRNRVTTVTALQAALPPNGHPFWTLTIAEQRGLLAILDLLATLAKL